MNTKPGSCCLVIACWSCWADLARCLPTYSEAIRPATALLCLANPSVTRSASPSTVMKPAFFAKYLRVGWGLVFGPEPRVLRCDFGGGVVSDGHLEITSRLKELSPDLRADVDAGCAVWSVEHGSGILVVLTASHPASRRCATWWATLRWIDRRCTSVCRRRNISSVATCSRSRVSRLSHHDLHLPLCQFALPHMTEP